MRAINKDYTMSEIQTPVPSSQEVFSEAFAAATGSAIEDTGENSLESTESTDLQDISSGTEVDNGQEELIADTEESEQTSEITEKSDNDLSIEEVAVKGKDGKRKNIKVDFSDRDKMKKYVQKAANAVKLQSERDALQVQVAKFEEAQTAMANLQEIVDTKGFEGLIEELNADNGGFKAWMDSKLSRHETRLHASEDELAKLDAQDRADELQRRLDRIEQQKSTYVPRGYIDLRFIG
jgi:hypothetical protein